MLCIPTWQQIYIVVTLIVMFQRTTWVCVRVKLSNFGNFQKILVEIRMSLVFIISRIAAEIMGIIEIQFLMSNSIMDLIKITSNMKNILGTLLVSIMWQFLPSFEGWSST